MPRRFHADSETTAALLRDGFASSAGGALWLHDNAPLAPAGIRRIVSLMKRRIGMARLEHVNMTVKDPKATAAMLSDLFGWHIRWEGKAMETGYTVHVGSDDAYVAAYSPGSPNANRAASYGEAGGLNHIGVVVEDLDAVKKKVTAKGYTPGETYDYEPGRRFYFREENGIEIEVVSYA